MVVENWHLNTHTHTCGLTSDLFWNPWLVANKGTKPVDSVSQIFFESISSLLSLLGHCDHFCFLPNSTFVLSLFSALHVYLLVSLESRSDNKRSDNKMFSVSHCFMYFKATWPAWIDSWLLKLQCVLYLFQYKLSLLTRLKFLLWILSPNKYVTLYY